MIINAPKMRYSREMVTQLSEATIEGFLERHYRLIKLLRIAMHVLKNYGAQQIRTPAGLSDFERRELTYTVEYLRDVALYSVGFRYAIHPLGNFSNVAGYHIPRFRIFGAANPFNPFRTLANRMALRLYPAIRNLLGMEWSKESTEDVFVERLQREIIDRGNQIEPRLYNPDLIQQARQDIDRLFAKQVNPVNLPGNKIAGICYLHSSLASHA